MKEEHQESSGNVFADIGLPHSKQELLSAQLTLQIYRLIRERALTQTKISALLGVTHSQASALMRCKPVSISAGPLMEFLAILGQDVEVTLKPTPKRKQGRMSVVVQAA